MIEIALKLIAAILPVIFFIATYIISSSSTFEQYTVTQTNVIESLYMKLLNIYSSSIEEKESKVREFIDEFNYLDTNTTFFATSHQQLLILRNRATSFDSFEEIEPFFDNFSITIENKYWTQHIYRLYAMRPKKGMDILLRKRIWKFLNLRMQHEISAEKRAKKPKKRSKKPLIFSMIIFSIVGFTAGSIIPSLLAIDSLYWVYLYVIYVLIIFLFIARLFISLYISMRESEQLKLELKGNAYIKRKASSYQIFYK